jgi:DNA-binding CsgD family transcriptional regulator
MDINLTPREMAISRLIAESYSNQQIAEKLNISHRTVEAHRARINKKMNIKTASQQIKDILNG